jgi:hypothetical protein
VSKVEINHRDAISGISTFIIGHRRDLLVATHGRQGINRWLHGSVSEEVLRRTRVPTLLIGPHSRDFVDAQSGKIRLRRILLPVAPEPEPSPAWTLNMLSALLSPLGVSGDSFELIHVAGEMPDIVDEAGNLEG